MVNFRLRSSFKTQLCGSRITARAGCILAAFLRGARRRTELCKTLFYVIKPPFPCRYHSISLVLLWFHSASSHIIHIIYHLHSAYWKYFQSTLSATLWLNNSNTPLACHTLPVIADGPRERVKRTKVSESQQHVHIQYPTAYVTDIIKGGDTSLIILHYTTLCSIQEKGTRQDQDR